MKIETAITTLEIPWNKVNVKLCTLSGLELALEMLVIQEWYEEAAVVRDEIKLRK